MRRYLVAANWHSAMEFLGYHLPSFNVLDLIPVRPLGTSTDPRGWLFEARIIERTS